MQYLSSSYRLLPSFTGVYVFLSCKNDVLYVGKAKNLKSRVSSYFGKDIGEKTKILVSQISKIKIYRVQSEIESLLLEANLIQKYKPKYNVKLTDGKRYPLIRITIKDKYPKILTARTIDEKNSIYFGPYPNSRALYAVLKLIRKIFPYQSVVNHPQKPCFYYHLGLCPCPEVFEDKNYRKNINHTVNFLKGKTNKVVKDLERERKVLSKKEKFEEALIIQQKIDAVRYITDSHYKAFDYEINPNLIVDLRNEEIDELKKILIKSGVKIEGLNRIECYDISNTSGKLSTSSLVVFVDGEKDSSLYRKFKIKYGNRKPNDFAMIEETIRRRLSHSEWKYPDLIIVDGGKGQISSALKAVAERNFDIPVIGLAKKEETIVTSEFKEIKLPKNSKALFLVMRLRDEAHRFAKAYHKKLRSKFITF